MYERISQIKNRSHYYHSVAAIAVSLVSSLSNSRAAASEPALGTVANLSSKLFQFFVLAQATTLADCQPSLQLDSPSE